MSFKIIVLGSSGGYAGAGRACSGYLLQNEDRTLALDFGPGSLSNLLKHVDADGLDGLVISHLHYDHYMDIYGLLTARRFWVSTLPPLPLMLPNGAAGSIARVISDESREAFMECVEVTELGSGGEFDFLGFEITAKPAQHVDGSFIFRISAAERTLCYSGDTDRCDSLLELAEGADMFLCEATFNSQVPMKIPGHLSGKEAGEIASEAEVGRLVLTHVWPTLEAERAVDDARLAYDGQIDVAIEGLTLYVGPYPCAI